MSLEAGVRGVSWEGGEPASACSHLAHSPLPPMLQGPRDALGARGASWERGEQVGSKGSELGAF